MEESQDPAGPHESEGGLPILFIHGWSMAGTVEAHDFEPVFTKKSEYHRKYHRIYLDLPGMGEAPMGILHDLDAMFERVSAFIDQNILPSNFLLIGTSCGAYLARALAYRFANAVDGLLLRVPLVEPLDSKRDVDPFVPLISNDMLMSSLSTAEREKLGNIPVQTPGYIHEAKRKTEIVWQPAIAAADSASLDPIRNDPSRYRLTAPMHNPEDPFVKPTLILTGRQDTTVGYRDAWPLVAAYPRATFVALDRADHGFPIDETGLFEALVQDWLRRVEELRRENPRVEAVDS